MAAGPVAVAVGPVAVAAEPVEVPAEPLAVAEIVAVEQGAFAAAAVVD